MLDVLMYLFEHYMDESAMIRSDHDHTSLKTHLTEAGFSHKEIHKAFGWLDGLTQHGDRNTRQQTQANNNSIRLYSWQESVHLNRECRGYLHFLEQSGILTPGTRELAIDRALALENDDIDLDKLKWVILMVLFNQPHQDNHSGWMEDLIFSEPTTSIH
jgi:Smg protein